VEPLYHSETLDVRPISAADGSPLVQFGMGLKFAFLTPEEAVGLARAIIEAFECGVVMDQIYREEFDR